MMKKQDELYHLLARIGGGEQEALGIFYDQTVGRVFGLALKITASHELAEEVVSDVYMQVWRSATQYSAERASPLAWLMMLAYSRASDIMRHEASITRHQSPLEEIDWVNADNLSDPLDTTLGLEQDNALNKALKLLDKQQKQMIILAFYRGMSHQEIARYTGKPLGSVKTLLRRAQSILRQALTHSGSGEREQYGQA